MAELNKKNGALALYGSKKGDSGRGAVEADDTLRSKAYARVLDAICEGEIEGLVDGAKSIYLNETPLVGKNGEENFKAQVDVRHGSQGQPHIEGFASVENEVNVSVQVKKDTPVVRTVTNQNVNAIRVKVLIPQLSEQDTKNGDINGSEVGIFIEAKSADGSFSSSVEDKIVGKTMSAYERAYKLRLKGKAPWTVRMQRTTDDATSAAINNKTFFSSLTEIVDSKLNYPNTAIVGIRVDASQFDSIPTRSYHMRLLRIRVPTNYDPVNRTYVGSWDGSFKIAWTNNPAWCFYDLMTSERYGLGQHIPESSVDKWGLYAIGRYCDQLVPDGKGGSEPRFTLNTYIQTREDAYKLVNDIAGAFRGMLYWAGGSIVAVQDAPSDPSYVFTNANVIDGEFSYSGSSMKVRHTVAQVTWSDLADMGRQKVEYVEDPQGVAQYGVIATEVVAFGCTSQAQAHRAGRWILLSELTETETVSFATGLEGVALAPGRIIKVRDNYRYGKRLGGRIVASTTDSVTLDSEVTLSGKDATLYIVTPDGKAHTSKVTGGGNALRLATPMEKPAARGATWVLSLPGEAKPRDYRVVNVADKGDGTYDVTALQHNANKYAQVDDVQNLGVGGGGELEPGLRGPAMPGGLKVVVVKYMDGSVQKYKLVVSWANGNDPELSHWEVEHRTPQGNPTTTSGITMPGLEIDGVVEGYHTIRVRAINARKVASGWTNSGPVFVGNEAIVTPDDSGVFTHASARGSFLSISLDWRVNPAVAGTIASVEVWGREGEKPKEGDTSPEPEMRLLATVPGTVTHWNHIDLLPGDPWTYRVRAVDKLNAKSNFYPKEGMSATPNVDVTNILDRLSDSFTNSQFYRDLTSKIEDIDLPDLDEIRDLLGEGGIQRLEDELERIRRDQNRSGELLLRGVVVDEQVRSEASEGIARALDAVSIVEDGLALEVNRREILSVEVQDTRADLLREGMVRADGDSALASQITALAANVDSELSSANALIVQEQQARASADQAITSQIDLMQSKFEANLDEQGRAITSAVAAIEKEEATRASADQAIAATVEKVGADLKTSEAQTRALISQESQARVDSDSALATSVSGVQARFDNFSATGKPSTSLEARVASESTARADGDAANAQQITQVQARLNNSGGTGVTVEQRFTTTASQVDGLRGQYTIKIDNNGHVSGFGLASVPVNGTPVSTFAVAADRFVIASPYVGNKTPFQVITSPTTLNGAYVPAGVYITDAFIRNGMMDTLKIAGGSVTSMAYGEGSISYGSGSVVPCKCYIDMPAGSTGVVVSGTVNLVQPNTGDWVGVYIQLLANGRLIAQTYASLMRHLVSTASISGFDPSPTPGTNVYSLQLTTDTNYPGFVNAGRTSITAVGGKR